MFVLPLKVHKEIDASLRAFLWSGVEMNKHKARIAWDDVCVPKDEGGLGIMRSKEWNVAATLKHIWNLCNLRNKTMWVCWVRTYLIRSRNFWALNIPSECTWVWRHILKLRDMARMRLKYFIGNGKSTSLWYDNWHPKGPLISVYGDRIIYDAGLANNTMVCDVVEGENWRWPVANSWALMDMRKSITFDPSFEEDKIWWIPSSSGQFTIKSAWEETRKRKDKVEWYNLVWFPKAIPRYAMILWMAIKERLPTKDKLVRYDISSNDNCCFCNLGHETMDHLFFGCIFTKSIWIKVLASVDLGYLVRPWKDYINHINRKWRGIGLKFLLRKLCLGVTVYWVWRERNSRVFGGDSHSSTAIVTNIKNVVRDRALEFRKIKPTFGSRKMADNWGLPTMIFS